MFGGLTTKVSEATIASTTTINQKTDLIHLTGSTAIATINPNFGGGFGGICVLVPTDGTLGLTTAGNIAVAVTMPQNRSTVLTYSSTNSKWYPGAIS